MAKHFVTVAIFAAATVFLFMVYKPQIKELINSRNGGYSQWTAWSRCTRSCNGGQRALQGTQVPFPIPLRTTQVRTRNCTNPRPRGFGRSCSFLGQRIEFGGCNEQPCPIDGKLGNWGEWRPCNKQCGQGEQVRERSCEVFPKHGGRPCNPTLFKETRPCTIKPCPVDGKYSDWKPYGACSATCGPGKKERTRECNNPAPAHGGKACEGPAKETADCNEKACPTPKEEKKSEAKKKEKKKETNPETKKDEKKQEEKKTESKKEEKKPDEKKPDEKKEEKKPNEKKLEEKKEEKKSETNPETKKDEKKQEEKKTESKKEEKKPDEKKPDEKKEEKKPNEKKLEEKKEEKKSETNPETKKDEKKQEKKKTESKKEEKKPDEKKPDEKKEEKKPNEKKLEEKKEEKKQ